MTTPLPVPIGLQLDLSNMTPRAIGAALRQIRNFIDGAEAVDGAVMVWNGKPLPTYTVNPPTPGRKEFWVAMPGVLTDTGGTAPVSVQLYDADGNPTTPDQDATWEDSAGLLTLAPGGGTNVAVTPQGPLGDGTLTMTVVDNDGTTVVVPDTYTVVAGEATTGTMAWGTQVPAAGG
jgi:hypothetical protein